MWKQSETMGSREGVRSSRVPCYVGGATATASSAAAAKLAAG